MADLTVTYRSVCFFVVPNYFLCTDIENDDMMTVLCSFGISPKEFSVMLEFVRNIHHVSQLLDCLTAVALVMLLD